MIVCKCSAELSEVKNEMMRDGEIWSKKKVKIDGEIGSKI